tara:strand:- start:262 stop:378 length:117 start_codon:yes stop_codon:yes gene_type:complete
MYKTFYLRNIERTKLMKRLADYTLNIGRNNIPTFGGIG